MIAKESYRTIAKDTEIKAEIIEKRSRFIAHLTHVESEQEASVFIDAIRAEHHDARHNVPTWILADGHERTSDDGEPQRTAGMPTLEVLRGAGLANICCVTTRYFGGTLLGTGGLVRAYSAAVTAALDSAKEQDAIITMTSVTPVVLTIPYSAYDRIIHLVTEMAGRVTDSIFAADVQLTCNFVSGSEAAFVRAVIELMGGDTEVCKVGEARFTAL